VFILTLLEKDPQNSNSEESLENRKTFSGSKFSPATGVSGRMTTQCEQTKILTFRSGSEIPDFGWRAAPQRCGSVAGP